VLHQLDRAYDNWWNPEYPAAAPTFRKRSTGLSVPFPGQAVNVRKLNRRWAEVRLPKIGAVRFRLSRPLGGMVRNATVRRDGLGWHVSFGIATGAEPAAPNGLPGCGVDFGVACSAYVSDETGPRLLPPTLTEGEQRRLLGLERRKARQVRWAKRHNRGRYSRRLGRTAGQIARFKARQARRRLDFTHKLTTDLAKSHGWVGVEDLRVRNMTRSAKGTALAPGRGVTAKAGLNRGILDNTPHERRRQLAYKAPRFGSELRLVPPAFTSQTCSASLRNSLLLALYTMALVVAAATLAAYALSRVRLPGRDLLLYVLLLFSSVVSGTAAMVPLFLLVFELGLINTYLGVTLVLSGGLLPAAIFILKDFTDTTPTSYEESARVFGASPFQILRDVVVPLVRPGMAVIAVWSIVNVWGNFLIPFILLRDPDLAPASVVTYSFYTEGGQADLRLLSAFSLLYSVPVVLMYLFVQRRYGFRFYGGIKR
jgi:ABC-type glycerol-3-phosphate transport system permease component